MPSAHDSTVIFVESCNRRNDIYYSDRRCSDEVSLRSMDGIIALRFDRSLDSQSGKLHLSYIQIDKGQSRLFFNLSQCLRVKSADF